ncbi:MAG: RNA methyltransferase [Eubacterium sp.]|nr:RNA methyltransferase [Eubacterium sp.]
MEISSRSNPLIKRYKELSNERKARKAAGQFVVEGEKSVREAVQSGCEAGDIAFISESAAKKYPDTVKLVKEKWGAMTITDALAEYISDTKTPQGIFITVKSLDKILNLSTIYNSTRMLYLENLQDTGNIGTIIRTCDALGIDGVIMSPDCADIYSPKTVRSTMGSIFRVPVYFETPDKAIPLLKEAGFAVYAAVLDEKAQPLGSFTFPQKAAAVIGNEGAGITAATRALCGDSVYIPMHGAESLNASVAAAIISWEMNKKDM